MRKIIHFLALVVVLLASLPIGLQAQSALAIQQKMLASPKQTIAKAKPLKAEAKSIPYNENFNDTVKWKEWSQIDNQTWLSSSDQDVWQHYQWGGPDYKGAAVVYQNHAVGLNTWLISPGLSLKGGMTYRISFWFQCWFAPVHHVYLLTSPTDTVTGRIKVIDIVKESSITDDFSADVEIPSDGTYYLAFFDNTPYRHNETALSYSATIDNIKVEAVSNNALPTAPTGLTQVPGANGDTAMSLKWKNPTHSKKGEQLDFLNYAKIYIDGKDSVVLTDSVLPGRQMSWTDPKPTIGKHTYSVLVGNTAGDGDAASVNTYIGVDKPGAPENLSVDYDADAGIITLDWDQPQFGQKGGWFDPAGISYRVVRQPGNKVLTSNLTSRQYEDDDIDDYANYVYQITTRTNSGLGATATSRGVLAGQSATLPIRQDWEDSTTYATWQVVDNNADGSTFTVDHSNGYNSASAIGWHFYGQNVGKDKDESLYAPPVELVAGKKYKVSCLVNSNPFSSFSLDITYGSAATKDAQTNTIMTYSDVTSGGGYAQMADTFQVSKSGRYFISWWLHDTPSTYVYFDNFRIEELFDNNLEATGLSNLNTAPTAGDKISTAVAYTNRGSKNASHFTVQLLDNDNNVLGSSSVAATLAAGATDTTNISWTVPDVEGSFAVRGKVIMNNDQCSADNETEPGYLNVQGTGLRAVTIGTGSEVSRSVPFSYNGGIISESIYRSSDFQGMAGNIDSLSFKVRFGMERDFLNVPFKIYLANTEQESMSTGWIQSGSMTKVFDGNIDMKTGSYDLTIRFDNPFSYTGGNLAVLVMGPADNTLFLQQGYGMGTYVTEYGLEASRIWSTDASYPEDPDNLDNTKGSFYSYVPNAIFYFNPSNCGSLAGTVTDTDGNPLSGVTVCGDNYSGYENIKATTDDDGKYFIKYVPSRSWDINYTATTKGYADESAYVNVYAGKTTTADFQLSKCKAVTLSGTVTSATDNATPVAGATIAIKGDNSFTATTDADGKYNISGVYAQKNYTIKVTAPGYQLFDNYGGYSLQFYSDNDSTASYDINITPTTASPYSVNAVDKGDTAVITWRKPIENISLTKASDNIVGQFGGAYEMAIGHRYTASELQALGADSLYYVKSLSLVPMSSSAFKISIWQGEDGNEEKVYDENFTPEKYGAWITVNLSRPYKIDPTKSLVIGYTVESNIGAFPVGIDAGPLVDGGDVIFDPTNNKWSTAHELVSSMNYNWAIKATLGNDNNSAAVPWVNTTANVSKLTNSFNTISVDSVAGRLLQAAPQVASAHYAVRTLPQSVRPVAPAKLEPLNAIKGYNVYRMKAGEESSTWNWTKLNSEPVTTTSYNDTTWNSADSTTYRYAVRSFYGNPSEWGEGVISDATFSDGVDKGHYATLTVNVNADKGDAEGASVRLEGDNKVYTSSVKDGKATFHNVRFTYYKLSAIKPLYDYYSKDITVMTKEAADTVNLAFHSKAPESLISTDYISEARLSWTAPSAANTAYLTLSTDTMSNAYGFQPGTEYICGQMITPDMLSPYSYNDFYIDRIDFYANAATTYSPLIWEGPDADQTVQMFRQDYAVSEDEVGKWNSLKLQNPIKIDPSKTYVVGYAVTGATGQFPMAIDNHGYSDSYGSLMYGWDQKNNKYGWFYVSNYGNWMVRAHITDITDPEKALADNVKYDIYRMNEADVADTTLWTKLNASPVSSTEYTDKTWKDLAGNTTFRYAVRSVFFGNTLSAFTLGKEMAKGSVTLLTANITTNNNLPAAGAVLRLHSGSLSYKAAAGDDGSIVLPEVAKGNEYEISLAKEGYDTINIVRKITADRDTLSFQLAEIKAVPAGLTAEAAADNSAMTISWLAPGSYVAKQGWAYWDTNSVYGGFGTSTGVASVAQLFTTADQTEKGMKDLDITKIAFFTTNPGNNPVLDGARWEAKIWRVNNNGTVDEVYSQPVDNVQKPAWNTVTLTTPYYVSGDEDLLIGYTFYGTGSPFGIDAGPLVTGKADWANFGSGWSNLGSSVNNFDYNILIHTYLSKADITTKAVAPAIAHAEKIGGKAAIAGGITPMKSAERAKAVASHPMLAYNYPVQGYYVYRITAGDEGDESKWTALTAEPTTATSYTDNGWSSVISGKQYRWAVKAAYVSGNSDAVLTDVFNSDGTDGIDEAVASNFSVKYVCEGVYEVSSPRSATLTVANAAGALVFRGQLQAGKNTVRLNAPRGIFIFNANADGFHKVQKVAAK